MIKKNEWALIHRIVLAPAERAQTIPEDTKKTPLEMWVKGWLTADAEIGSEVEVITRTGRREQGKLLEANPTYRHSFGDFMPELLKISEDLRKMTFEGGAV
jgi:hypothetical protein